MRPCVGLLGKYGLGPHHLPPPPHTHQSQTPIRRMSTHTCAYDSNLKRWFCQYESLVKIYLPFFCVWWPHLYWFINIFWLMIWNYHRCIDLSTFFHSVYFILMIRASFSYWFINLISTRPFTYFMCTSIVDVTGITNWAFHSDFFSTDGSVLYSVALDQGNCANKV